ncbi:WD40 repeat domain-containing protein [Candidatus Dependentiae bacterium]|nr:WD40 repeat domain-containing protein [Candidatus Dependentiae bacterium]
MKKNLLRSIFLLVCGVLVIAPNLMSIMPTLTEQSFNVVLNQAKNTVLDLAQPCEEEANKLMNMIYVLTKQTLSSINQQLPESLLGDLAQPKHRKLKGHKAAIHSIMEYDNGILASASDDFTMRNWEPQTGKCIATTNQHIQRGKPVIQLKNGTFVIPEGNDLQVIDPELQKPIATPQGHTQAITSLTLLQNGNFVSASNDHTLKIWNGSTYECIQTLTGHTDAVTGVACLKNGLLISSSNDCSIKLWNPVTHECLTTLMNNADAVTSVIPLKNGNFASVSNNIITKYHTIKIWNTQTGEPIKTLEGHRSLISVIIELNNGNIASASWDKTIRIWNLDPFEISNFFEKNKSPEERLSTIQKIALILQLEHLRQNKEYQTGVRLHDSWLKIFNRLPVSLQEMYKQHFCPITDEITQKDNEESCLKKKNYKKNYKIL